MIMLPKYDSTLFVYDDKPLKERCDSIKTFSTMLSDGLPDRINVSMHYSQKHETNPGILAIVEQYGLNVNCNSRSEFIIDNQSGFTSDRILYVSDNISPLDMAIASNDNILICLGSIYQVETWGKSFPNTNIMIKINSEVTGFEISEEYLRTLFDVTMKYNLHIIGIHQHLGSLFLNDNIDDYIAGIKASLDIVKKHFKEIKIIGFGDGFGVPYAPYEKSLNLSSVASKLLPVLNEFISSYPSVKEFKFETGKYIPCSADILKGSVNPSKALLNPTQAETYLSFLKSITK